MLQLLGVVVSIGLVDAMNPSTVAPALYIAAAQHSTRQLLQFTVGVFAVYFLGGAAILFGPGRLLLSIAPHLSQRVRDMLEIGLGGCLVIGAVVLWTKRHALAARHPPKVRTTGKSNAVLGATIMAVELPTAFPYFAVIAAIVGSGIGAFRQLVLLGVFNLCFVLPLLMIVAALQLGGDRADRLIALVRSFLTRRWPHVLAVVLALLGAGLAGFGASGLATLRGRRGHASDTVAAAHGRPLMFGGRSADSY